MDQTSTAAPRARILSNLYLPAVEGYAIRCFGEYLPPAPAAAARTEWRAEMERRDLPQILPLIPAAEKPDILVCASPEYLPIPWDLHAFRGPKVLLITDWNVCLRFLPDLCKLFDYCFTDWPGYRLLKKAGVGNVHHQAMFGHDPAKFRPLGLERNLDVSFCGNLNSGLHGERNRLVARVARWAHRTGRPVHLRQAFGDAYAEVLNRSRLVFNYAIRGEANMRLFEAMACGAVPLVEETNQEAGILFQEGRHYFRYPLGGLEAKLDELLAQPDRVAAVAAEAQKEVRRHTKARQYEALLDTVLREEGKAGAAREPVMPAVESKKALAKIRVLGMGYTAQEAMQEIQARSAECPGLDIEALPGLLFAIMAKEGDPAAGPARRALEHLLGHPRIPGFLRAFLRLQAALQAKDWAAVLALADECRQAVETEDSVSPRAAGSIYKVLLPPVGLGHGMNSDINKACEEDMRAGVSVRTGISGGSSLLLEHCRYAVVQARLALGSAREALKGWSVPGPRAFASIPRLPLQLSTALEAGDDMAAKEACRAWFHEAPLDTSAWERILAGHERMGNKDGRQEFLREIYALSRYFLDAGQSDRIAALIGN